MRKCFEYYILDGLLSGMFNYASNQETNSENRLNSREERKWQERMTIQQNAFNASEAQKVRDWTDKNNQILFNREDTANSRAVVDAVNAGLSPLAVVGSGGAQASMLNTSAQASAASVPTPASYRATPSVMNMDMSSLIGAVIDNNKLRFEKDKYKSDHALAVLELEQKKEISDKQLLQQGTQFKQMYEQSEDHYLKDYAQRAEQFSAQTTQQANFHYDDLKEKEKQRAFEDIQASNKMYAELARDMAQSAGIPVVYYPVTSVEDYNRGIDRVSNYLVSGNGNVISDYDAGKFKSFVNKNGAVNVSGVAGASVGAGENRENVAKEAVKGAYLENGIMRVPILVRGYTDWETNYSYLNNKSSKKSDNKSGNNVQNVNTPVQSVAPKKPRKGRLGRIIGD